MMNSENRMDQSALNTQRKCTFATLSFGSLALIPADELRDGFVFWADFSFRFVGSLCRLPHRASVPQGSACSQRCLLCMAEGLPGSLHRS